MDGKWAVVFDFDGTLIPKSYGSLYDVIDSNGGVTAECHERAKEMRKYYLALAHAGKLTKKHQEKWLVDSLNIYISSGLTVPRIREILSGVSLRTGVKECLLELRVRNVPVAVVSYGVFQFIDSVLRSNGVRNLVRRVYSANLETDDSGAVNGFSENTFVFPFNKGKCSRDFADNCDVSYRNILAVGDSPSGDRQLGYLKENRLGIAGDKMEKERLLSVMGSVAVTETFQPATRWLLGKIDGR